MKPRMLEGEKTLAGFEAIDRDLKARVESIARVARKRWAIGQPN